MADPFVAEIRIFPYNFAPKGWAFCNGQLMPLSQNTALFSLVGTYYGGDGKTTFGLPNIQSRTVVGVGSGPGLTPRQIGEVGGEPTVTLQTNAMAAHSHSFGVYAGDPADLNAPAANRSLARSSGGSAYAPANNLVPLAPQAVGLTGGGQPHNNLQPYLQLNYCIALTGIYPPRG